MEDGNREIGSSELRIQFLLLFSLVAILVLQPVVQPLADAFGLVGRLALQVAYLSVLLVGVVVGKASRRFILSTRVAAGAAFAAGALSQVYEDLWLGLLALSMYIVVFALVITRLLGYVLSDSRVVASKLCGAVTVYLMIGIAGGLVYQLLELAAVGSFSAGDGGTVEPPDLVYFSLVTLSTLGYGDIVPISRAARILAALQAMFGPMYLAILVARLVGLSAKRWDQEG